MTLTIFEDHRASGKQTQLATFFDVLIRITFDVILEQFKLNIMILFLNQIYGVSFFLC